MNMRNAVRQYSFMKKDSALIRYFIWLNGVESGFPNGLNDIKSMGLKILKIGVVPQRRYGGRPPSVWLKRLCPSEKSWNLTRVVALLFLASEPRLFIGSLNKERFAKFLLSLPLPISSFVTGKLVKLSPKEISIISLILTLRQRRSETSIKQILLDQDISEAQKELSDSIPFILWMWQAIRLSQVSSPISRASLCANILLRHGDLGEFLRYPRWITKWLPQEEDDIPTASLKSFAFTCFWVSILYLSLKENREEMHRLKALINSGRKECLEDIVVPTFFLLEEPVNVSCDITFMRNPTGVLPKKNMAQDSLGYSKIASGKILDTCQKDLTLINTSIPKDVSISLLQGEGFLLFERLTLMVKLRSMVLHISSGENLKGNMLLLLFLLIEGDWSLNKKIRLSSLSLSQLMVVLLLLCFQLQRGRLNLVSDVIRFLSIRNQLTMLLVQSIIQLTRP